MGQLRTRDTVDLVKELVSQLTPDFIISSAVDNLDGTFTLETINTYWLTINKRITIDSIEYRITAFVINESITIKPITTGDPIPTVTLFTIPAPLFFHGVTLMAADEQGKPKDPTERTPFVWLYEILDETVIRDDMDAWGRNSKPQLFFMDESSLSNWTSAQHKTNVLEPMRQAVELFFDKINDFKGDKYKEVLTWTETGRANWGKFITDLGSVKKFFNEDLSGHQVGYDFTMSKTACSEEVAPSPDPFTPLSVEGLQTWLDASDSSLVNGGALVDDPVSTLSDKTTNGFNATQGVAGSRPIFKGDHILFNGVDEFLTMGTAISKLAARTVFIVFEKVGASANQRVYAEANSSGQTKTTGLSLNISPSGGKLRSSYGDNVNFRITDSSTNNSNDKILFTESFSAPNAPLTAMQVNGIDETETDFLGTATTIAGSKSDLSLGRNGENSGGYANYKLYAFLVYDSDLSSANKTLINNYLISQYSI